MTTATFTLPARRFAWKEYRTLRGLWLAVAALAIMVQAISALFSAPGTDLPAWLFGSALAAAALYAVGAAAILFAVEHEDETYNFLTGLPVTWLPVFAGKLLVATLSALALAITLLLTGWAIAGARWPTPYLAVEIADVYGIAILEALVWGTLFSIALRQPLLAALLAIFAASASVTLLVNLFVDGTTPTLLLTSYAHVAPARLLLLVGIALIDVGTARRWLALPSVVGTFEGKSFGVISFPSRSIPTSPFASTMSVQSARYSRASVITHLLWQSWRQSWATIVLMLGIIAFGCFVVMLILGITDPHRSYQDWMPVLPFAFALVAAALFTSTVFYADQRRNQYGFLAEHAARPRYVWICRLAIWAMTIVLVLALVSPLLYTFWSEWAREFGRQVPWEIRYGSWYGASQFSRNWTEIAAAARGTMFSLWGVAIGFAIGQLCSLVFRRALVAGFAALLVAIIAMAWGGIIWAWELSWTTFLLPLVIGSLVATWFRAPDWIVDRNHVRGWVKVAAAIALPGILVLTLLPPARRVTADAQLTKQIVTSRVPFVTGIPEWSTDVAVADAVAESVAEYESSATAEARANADRLLRLGDLVVFDPERPTRDNPDVEPTDEQWAKWREEQTNLNHDVILQAVEISRNDCRFPTWDMAARGSNTRDFASKHMFRLIELVSWAGESEAAKSQLDQALEYHLAALRLLGDMQRAQPTRWFALFADPIQRRLVDWAAQKGQTSESIRGAIHRLNEIYPDEFDASTTLPKQSAPNRPHPTLIADYVLLRDILTEKRLPISFDGNRNYLAYLANKLPFERARALRVLDYLLVDQTDQWLDLRLYLDQQRLREIQIQDSQRKEEVREKSTEEIASELRRRIIEAYEQSDGWPDLPPNTLAPPYSWLRTTYLLRTELGQLDPFGWFLQRYIDAEVAHWGLKLQLALIAYRIDHSAYPESLDAIAPEYLPFVPIDPYSGRPFEYRHAGLDRELQNGTPGIEPNTPLLWSVGLGNAWPRLFAVDNDANQQPKLEAVPQGARREVYRLHSERGVPYVESQLIFPLPK
jgi:hypothetical protein